MLALIVRFVLGTGVVLGLLWASNRYMTRRLGPSNRQLPSHTQIVHKLPVTRNSCVLRVNVGDQDLLLGCTPHTITLLQQLPAAIAEPPSAAPLLGDAGVAPVWAERRQGNRWRPAAWSRWPD